MQETDDFRDIRLMVRASLKQPDAVWREAVEDLLREVDRLQEIGGDVDRLAQIIRAVDGQNNLGAGALAEAILREMNGGQK